MNAKRSDQANQIKQAIAILRENNDKVTVKAVSDLTGIHIQTLYKHSAIRDLVRTHAKSHNNQKAKVKPLASDPLIPNIVLNQDVGSYMQHIRENYFSHGEALEDVKLDIRLTVIDFRDDVCSQALNKLLLSKEIKQCGHSANLFIAEFNSTKPVEKVEVAPVSESPEFVIFNELKMTFERVKGEAEMKERVRTMLDKDTNKVRIFVLTATAEKEIKITYESENLLAS